MINETICVVESESSDVEILNIGILEGMGIALGIGLIAFVGFIARGLFIYYLKYEAPKDRPINSLMFHDQVKLYFLLIYFMSKSIIKKQSLQISGNLLSGDPDFISVSSVCDDNSPRCHPNSDGEHLS